MLRWHLWLSNITFWWISKGLKLTVVYMRKITVCTQLCVGERPRKGARENVYLCLCVYSWVKDLISVMSMIYPCTSFFFYLLIHVIFKLKQVPSLLRHLFSDDDSHEITAIANHDHPVDQVRPTRFIESITSLWIRIKLWNLSIPTL